MFLDAHLHLQDITNKNVLEEILTSALQNNFGKFLCQATSPKDWKNVFEIADKYPKLVTPFYGIHPWYADEAKDFWDAELEKLKKTIWGLGETGLDKIKPENALEKQIVVFSRHLEIAERSALPVSIHCVQAWGVFLDLFRNKKPKKARLMIHSYHGSRETLAELIKLGFYISFSWKWLRKEKRELLESVKMVPDNKLLLETDFPYVEPGKIGGEITAKSYKKYLLEAYEIAARTRGVDLQMLEKSVWQNCENFLGNNRS